MASSSWRPLALAPLLAPVLCAALALSGCSDNEKTGSTDGSGTAAQPTSVAGQASVRMPGVAPGKFKVTCVDDGTSLVASGTPKFEGNLKGRQFNVSLKGAANVGLTLSADEGNSGVIWLAGAGVTTKDGRKTEVTVKSDSENSYSGRFTAVTNVINAQGAPVPKLSGKVVNGGYTVTCG